MHIRQSVYLCFFLAATLFDSSPILSQQTSTTTVSATPLAPNVGQAVSISATVAGQTNAIPIPTGSVSFFDSSTNLGSATLASLAVASPKVVTFAQLFGTLDTTSQGTVLWSDLNGDGKPDLLSFGTTFQVFLNNGNGTFTTLPSQPYTLSVAAFIDFNGDGNIDIVSVATSGADSGTVQVLYGNGNGVFQAPIVAPNIVLPPPTSGESTSATSLAVADLAGTGKPYLLVGNQISTSTTGDRITSNATITVFKNGGNGLFTSIGSFPVAVSGSGLPQGESIEQILLTDLNGDGKLDVAVWFFDTNLPSISASSAILLNNGDGTLAAPTTIFSSGQCYYGCNFFLAAGDFANRSKTDIALLEDIPQGSSPVNNSILIYPGNGDGTFSPAVVSGVNTSYYGSSQILTEDINGDGKLDLIDSLGYAHLGNGDFTFQSAVSLPGTSSTTDAQPLSADFSGDGTPDLLFNYTAPLILLGSRSSITALPSITNLAAGVHPITASYAGDANFSASTSSAVNVTVGKFTTTVTGTATPSPALSTQAISLSAQVATSGPVPTGTITFTQGTTTLGSAALNANGAATITATLGTVGTQSITVSYPGDTANLPSTGSITAVTIANFPSSTSVMASPNPAVAGQTVTFSTVVTPSGTSPTPTGNVIFLNGATQLGTTALDSTGKASFTTSFASVGNQTVTANYAGDAANQPSSASIVEAILTAFNLQAAGNSNTLSATTNSSAATPLTLTGMNGFTGNVSFSCTGLPAGATCSFNPPAVTLAASASATVTMTVTTAATVGTNTPPTSRDRSTAWVASVFFGGLLFLLPTGKRGRLRMTSFLFAILLASAFGITGCSGSSPAPTSPSTFNFNVVASSGTAQVTAPFILTVK
jgi:hypothetical protein